MLITSISSFLIIYSIYTHFDASTTGSFRKHCGISRNCSQRAISPFPTMFSTQSDNCTPFVHSFDIIFLFAAELEEPKIGIRGKGLTGFFTSIFSFSHNVFYLIEDRNNNFSNNKLVVCNCFKFGPV